MEKATPPKAPPQNIAPFTCPECRHYGYYDETMYRCTYGCKSEKCMECKHVWHVVDATIVNTHDPTCTKFKPPPTTPV